MAATGYTPISLYYSTTAAAVPVNTNLVNGELAINITDGKLYYKDNAGVVQVIAGKGGAGVAGGSNTQVQYNSSGSLAGSANMTFNGTTLTLANDASISGLTVGKGGGNLSHNTAVGVGAIGTSNAGDYNAAFGYNALTANTSGTQNNVFGYAAIATTTGSFNSVFGTNALLVNTTGGYNSVFGVGAMYSNTTGSNNIGIGYQSLLSNTTASYSTAVGYQSGYSSNASGTAANTSIGALSLYTNSTGTNNTASGMAALYANTTGSYNTAIGRDALQANTTASNNTAVGYQAGYSNTTGVQNVFVGNATGYSNTTGFNNTFVGNGSGYFITTGTKNAILGGYSGNQGGLDIRTASNYIVLSDGDGNPRQVINGSGQVSFGSVAPLSSGFVSISASANTYNIFVIQDTGTTGGSYAVFTNSAGSVAGSISHATATTVLYNTTSDYRLKTVVGSVTDAGQRIDALEPIEYDWNNGGGRTRGFLAHKFAEVYPNSVSGEKDAMDENGNPKYQAMQAATSEVMADLIAEIQSLRKRVATLEAK